MKIVFYRCQAIYISCRTSNSRNIAIWPHVIVTSQVFKHGKEDPMQLSDIIPNDLMYDKMRPPKMEGEGMCRV